jgi:hypothetical protein
MVQAVQWVGGEVNRGENLTCPIPFFSQIGYEEGAAIASRYPIYSSTHQRRDSMAKGMTQKKATKKKPAKTVKEKRADKVAKRKG